MAAVTLLGSATFNTTNGTKTVTATPAVGDLLTIVTAHSANTSTTPPTDDNADGLGTYSLLETATSAAGADTICVFVRDALIGSATSTVFTHAPGTTSGGGLAVVKATGMSRFGSSAERQSAQQSNQSSGTPTPVFGFAPLTTNPVIGVVYNNLNPAAMTPRSSPAYSELFDNGHTAPTRGLEIMSIDSGETGTSIQWGGSSSTNFASIVVELDATVHMAPSAGALTLTGLAPSALISTTAQPASGALTLAAALPVHVFGKVERGEVGAAAIAGLAPTLLVGSIAQPGAGALTMSGLAPTVARGEFVQPGSGALTLAGLAPTVARGEFVQPGAGALTMSGEDPRPRLGTLIGVGSGGMAASGQAPIGLLGSVEQAGAGALTLAGLAPSAIVPILASPPAGAIVLTGLAPSASVSATSADPDEILAAPGMGYLRTRTITMFEGGGTASSPSAGSLALSGLVPVALLEGPAAPGSGTLTLSGLAPVAAVSGDSDSGGAHGALSSPGMGYLRTRTIVVFEGGPITPSAGSLTLAGAEPLSVLGVVAQPGAGALALSGLAPDDILGAVSQPTAAALAISGLTPVAAVSDFQTVEPGAGALAITGYAPDLVSSSPECLPDAGALAIFGCEPTIVVTSDGVLSAKYLGGRRKNVPFKPVGGKKKKDEPKRPELKPSPLLLGLLARGLALPVEEPAAIVTPQLPEIVLAPLPPAPLPTSEELLQARVDSLEQQMQAMRDEIAALRAPVAAPSTPRDPLAEAMHAILPAIGRPIDLDAGPPDDDEPMPDEPVEIEPPPPAPSPRPKMTREQIERENERRAAMAADLLL